jgi:hypothetical protein
MDADHSDTVICIE